MSQEKLLELTQAAKECLKQFPTLSNKKKLKIVVESQLDSIDDSKEFWTKSCLQMEEVINGKIFFLLLFFFYFLFYISEMKNTDEKELVEEQEKEELFQKFVDLQKKSMLFVLDKNYENDLKDKLRVFLVNTKIPGEASNEFIIKLCNDIESFLPGLFIIFYYLLLFFLSFFLFFLEKYKQMSNEDQNKLITDNLSYLKICAIDVLEKNKDNVFFKKRFDQQFHDITHTKIDNDFDVIGMCSSLNSLIQGFFFIFFCFVFFLFFFFFEKNNRNE